MKILITGINGFLGRNLINTLKNKHELFGLGTQEALIEGVPVFSGRDLDELDFNVDVIVICHAAVASGTNVLSNTILFDVNVLLTEKIVAKFKDAFIIYISTVSIYDMNLNITLENSQIFPQSNYALSKLWAEKIISLNKNHAVLRISSMYGIGMKENTIIPNYVNQALENNTIEVWGKGGRFQNYIHVSDVVKYINLIIEQKDNFSGKLFLGVSKEQHTNLEIAEIISKITKAKISFINEDSSKSFCYNNDFTNNLLNWEPKKNIKETLQSYIEWKKKKY